MTCTLGLPRLPRATEPARCPPDLLMMALAMSHHGALDWQRQSLCQPCWRQPCRPQLPWRRPQLVPVAGRMVQAVPAQSRLCCVELRRWHAHHLPRPASWKLGWSRRAGLRHQTMMPHTSPWPCGMQRLVVSTWLCSVSFNLATSARCVPCSGSSTVVRTGSGCPLLKQGTWRASSSGSSAGSPWLRLHGRPAPGCAASSKSPAGLGCWQPRTSPASRARSSASPAPVASRASVRPPPTASSSGTRPQGPRARVAQAARGPRRAHTAPKLQLRRLCSRQRAAVRGRCVARTRSSLAELGPARTCDGRIPPRGPPGCSSVLISPWAGGGAA
mmetsp:Transcript_109573/g.353660  ORF Transcript_109573/g.353660 Transcript_109573/m.353660 type:complete len:330 (-) Transcript_109573:63-1052(-)